MKYDDYKLQSPPDCKTCGKCEFCKDEINEGESILDTTEGTIHEECLLPMAYEKFKCLRREAREE